MITLAGRVVSMVTPGRDGRVIVGVECNRGNQSGQPAPTTLQFYATREEAPEFLPGQDVTITVAPVPAA